MSSTTTTTTASTLPPTKPNENSLPHHSKFTTEPTSTIKTTQTEVSIPDGRRNSSGEQLHSPIETWQPDLKLTRNQSWNHQDLKRMHVEEGLKKEEWRNDEGVAGLGYSYEGVEKK